jgi:hypothetical protein
MGFFVFVIGFFFQLTAVFLYDDDAGGGTIIGQVRTRRRAHSCTRFTIESSADTPFVFPRPRSTFSRGSRP